MIIEKLIEELKDHFGNAIVKAEKLRPNRGIIRIDPGIIVELTTFLFRERALRFIIASGFDSREGLEITYHFMHDDSGFILNVNVVLPRDHPEIESITPVIAGANWIEREIMEILGIRFLNHPQPEKLLSDENWEEGEYPYRRKTVEEA